MKRALSAFGVLLFVSYSHSLLAAWLLTRGSVHFAEWANHAALFSLLAAGAAGFFAFIAKVSDPESPLAQALLECERCGACFQGREGEPCPMSACTGVGCRRERRS